MEEKELYIIGRMNVNNYFDRWRSIRDAYKTELDEGSISSNIKYTTHNYSTHCINIYKAISNIIVFRDGRNITPTEAFILNVSVVLHDIIMSYNIEKRNVHMEEAYKYIMESIKSSNKTILNTFLSLEEGKYVAYTVLGHSDIEGNNTLKYLADIYADRYAFENIKFPYLAAILRLGDELDCTRNRLNRPIGIIPFDNSKEDKISRKHYRKLELIDMVGIKQIPNNVIYLYVEDNALSSDVLEDAKLILSVKNKILSEINNIKECICNRFPQEISPIRNFNQIEIVTANNKLQEILNDLK